MFRQKWTSRMEVNAETISLSSAVITLFGMLVTVTKLLLKEKDSKLKMLREFYQMTKEGSDDE